MHKLWMLLAVATITTGCAQPTRYGMVEDPETGLMWGSAVEKNLIIDASQLENRTVKLNLRNVSGDSSYDLTLFRTRLLDALRSKGYTPTDGNDFGIKFDVNVLYSGHVQNSLSGQFAFLGGAAGGVAGYQGTYQSRNMAAGMLAGATLGAIAGSYARDDTYITVAEVTVAVTDQYRGTTKKTVTFSASPPLQEVRPSSIKPFEALLQTKVAVYAGGRNTTQRQISGGVRERLARIIADAI
ncbi:MAG: complement resistance protein TraT [Thiobacillus sp.]|nr:complement resistance protein TraT [Thiobacillus sp.]